MEAVYVYSDQRARRAPFWRRGQGASLPTRLQTTSDLSATAQPVESGGLPAAGGVAGCTHPYAVSQCE